jgi:TadE-like protein
VRDTYLRHDSKGSASSERASGLHESVRSARRGRLGDERGVALTEFALVLPILVVVIAGILAFGLIFFYWLDANRLASETARWAAVDSNPFDPLTLQQHIQEEVPNGMKDASVCISFPGDGESDPDPREIGDPVQVTVQKTVSLVPILGLGDVPIRASATRRIERFANGLGPPQSYSEDGDLGTCS